MAAGAKQVKVVGNEKIGNIFFFLHLFQYPDDLRLYGNIQHRSGLIKNQKPGFQKKKPSETYTLQFSSGKLVGITVQKLFSQLEAFHHVTDFLTAGNVHSVYLRRFFHGFPDFHPRI